VGAAIRASTAVRGCSIKAAHCEETCQRRFTCTEGEAGSLLDERCGQQRLFAQPVDDRIAGGRQAARREVHRRRGFLEPRGAPESDAGCERVAAGGRCIVEILAIGGEVGVPLLAQREFHQPAAAQRARDRLVAVGCQECRDVRGSRRIRKPALQARGLQVRVERVTAQGVAVHDRGAGGRRGDRGIGRLELATGRGVWIRIDRFGGQDQEQSGDSEQGHQTHSHSLPAGPHPAAIRGQVAWSDAVGPRFRRR